MTAFTSTGSSGKRAHEEVRVPVGWTADGTFRPLAERFRRRPPDPASPVLIAIPHAGAGASVFFSWRARLPAHVELAAIRLPGRESHVDEPPLASVAAAASLVVSMVHVWAPKDFAIFGQCSGAVIAFEAARALQEIHGKAPAHLFVASQRPPDEISGEIAEDGSSVSNLDDEAFCRYLRISGMLPDEITHEDPIWEAIAPAMRADLLAMESYEFKPGSKLSTPVTALTGTKDSTVTSQMMAGWARQTSDFGICEVNAGHLLALEVAEEVLQHIAERWLHGSSA